ncbi:hypothetical protein CYMTET_27317, partial [Cymbomonas tetramitiformis]
DLQLRLAWRRETDGSCDTCGGRRQTAGAACMEAGDRRQAEDGSQESGVKLLTTELSPDLQQTLGMRAAFHRTIAARTASGLFEVDITGSQLDNFQLSPTDNFPYRCEPLEEKALEGWSIPLAEFCKEWPKRLRESTDEEVGEIKGVGADIDIAEMSSSATV